MLLTETSETPKVWLFWTCPGLILSIYSAKMIKTKPDISIYMTFRIVHSYFFRFRLIRREIRHFVFRIGFYHTNKVCSSAIPLRVAAKTRTKPTGAPSTVYRTNMTLAMASCRFDSIYSWSLCETNPYTALMADMHIDGFDAYHYATRNKR